MELLRGAAGGMVLYGFTLPGSGVALVGGLGCLTPVTLIS
jgi:hypothetical protein